MDMDRDIEDVLRDLGVKIKMVYGLPIIKKVFNEVLEHYIFNGEVLISKLKMYAIEKSGSDTFTIYILHPRRSNPPLELLYWDQLLKMGMTFVHAAGVVWRNRTIIFPAWPKTGKTSIVISLLKFDRSAMLLGDDYIILSTDGHVYPYPGPFAIYSYHIPLFLEHFQRHPLDIIRLKIASKFLKIGLYSRFLKTFKIEEPLWIPVRRIFPHRLASRGKIEKVFLLTRSLSTKNIMIEPLEKEAVITHMYLCLIYDLIAPVLQDAIALTYFGFIDLFKDLQRSLEILKEALKQCECYRLTLPKNIDLAEIITKLLLF
jgi:hypothetical protein